MTPETLTQRVAQLQTAVRDHKVAIRQRRAQLARDAAALAHLEAECRRRGIAFRVERETQTQNVQRS